MTQDQETLVKEVLESLRPNLQADGGDVELVSIAENLVTVRLLGHCAGCPYHQQTLKGGIERILKEQVCQDITVENAY
ncbi:MAG: NifU family protein [Lentisphaeria bacterium]|nr:NifU family protein [Lentisphaeria bacterium]